MDDFDRMSELRFKAVGSKEFLNVGGDRRRKVKAPEGLSLSVVEGRCDAVEKRGGKVGGTVVSKVSVELVAGVLVVRTVPNDVFNRVFGRPAVRAGGGFDMSSFVQEAAGPAVAALYFFEEPAVLVADGRGGRLVVVGSSGVVVGVVR